MGRKSNLREQIASFVVLPRTGYHEAFLKEYKPDFYFEGNSGFSH
jgi:hypothetical protein